MNCLYKIALEVTRVALFFTMRVRHIGRENIPSEGGYVVACNHRCVIDPIIVAHGMKREVAYMAKAELFDIPVLGWILRHIKVFPVARGTGDTSAVEHAIQSLRDGGLLGIFPEGTRSPDGNLLKFKSGTAHIAKSAEVGVIPCVVRYNGEPRLWGSVELIYGTPMSYEELFGDEQSAAALKRATKLVRARMSEMLGLEEKTQ